VKKKGRRVALAGFLLAVTATVLVLAFVPFTPSTPESNSGDGGDGSGDGGGSWQADFTAWRLSTDVSVDADGNLVFDRAGMLCCPFADTTLYWADVSGTLVIRYEAEGTPRGALYATYRGETVFRVNLPPTDGPAEIEVRLDEVNADYMYLGFPGESRNVVYALYIK